MTVTHCLLESPIGKVSSLGQVLKEAPRIVVVAVQYIKYTMTSSTYILAGRLVGMTIIMQVKRVDDLVQVSLAG